MEGLIPWQGNQTEPNARGMALLGNPFAILGVTPRTPVDELFDRADTPEAATAARALSVPRSRLAAEASFLPGVSDAATGILAALRAGRRVDPAGLPPLAAANLRAHLCAAGLATGDDVAALVSSMPAGADAALVAAIDADRAVAGMPPCQQAALAEEIEALTDSHAAALVTACEAGADPAGQLAGLIEDGPARPPPSCAGPPPPGYAAPHPLWPVCRPTRTPPFGPGRPVRTQTPGPSSSERSEAGPP